MKIVFLSNFLNHHQIPLCETFCKLSEEFYFVATVPVPADRKKLGYADANMEHDYVVRAYESKEAMAHAIQLCKDCDILITGSAPEYIVKERLKLKKLTFRYSERIYRNNKKKYQIPGRAVKYFFKHTRHKNLYLLCSSAYTAADYAKTGTFLNKAYRWAYFPEVKTYDVEQLMDGKQGDVPVLLWVGRYLELKHADHAIEVAARLKKLGYAFRMEFVGTGPLEEKLQKLTEEKSLTDCVRFLGSMSPEDVRAHMEKASVYLFTSDRAEGWGAVLNESMNSGCAVVASHAIGAVPFLMKDGENGLIYASCDVDMLFEKTKYLLDHPEEQRRLGTAAYETMVNLWNGETAAKRLLELAECLSRGEKTPFAEGPCSKAERLKDDWFINEK